VFVYATTQRLNYTYCFTATCTAQPEKQFIIRFMIFWPNAGLLNNLSGWATCVSIPIRCAWCIDVCFSSRFLVLLTSSWNAVINSSGTVQSSLPILNACYSLVFLLCCTFESLAWHDKIAPVRPPPVARLSLNKHIVKNRR